MHKKELVMTKPRTHMLDVATESSIDSLLIHTVAWLENTCNNSSIMVSLIIFHLRLLQHTHACNTPYLHFCLRSDTKNKPKCTFGLNKETRDLNHAHSLMSMQ